MSRMYVVGTEGSAKTTDGDESSAKSPEAPRGDPAASHNHPSGSVVATGLMFTAGTFSIAPPPGGSCTAWERTFS